MKHFASQHDSHRQRILAIACIAALSIASNLFVEEAYRAALRFVFDPLVVAELFVLFVVTCAPLFEARNAEPFEAPRELPRAVLPYAAPRFDPRPRTAARRLRIDGASRTGSATFNDCPALTVFAER